LRSSAAVQRVGRFRGRSGREQRGKAGSIVANDSEPT
jgi:hypothetical protein